MKNLLGESPPPNILGKDLFFFWGRVAIILGQFLYKPDRFNIRFDARFSASGDNDIPIFYYMVIVRAFLSAHSTIFSQGIPLGAGCSSTSLGYTRFDTNS